MNKITTIITKCTAAATIVASLAAFAPQASAAEFGPSSTTVDPWIVSTLAHDTGSSRIEAYKVDKNIVAWSELSGAIRKLYVYDGVSIRLLASFSASDWSNDGNGFYDAVSGNFDVADGTVVWTMSDGTDREIYSFNGESVAKVSDNTFDDRHPIVSAGRIAWTSQPPGSQYNLMLRDVWGIRLVDSWQVPNYAFSGGNLYWLNMKGNENWFRVFVNTGLVNAAVGEGDDRALSNYFITDGKGSAAWEYSTKQWSYDKRKVYESVGGAPAILVLQRDVPPMVTRVEDMDSGIIMMNVTDLLLTDLQHKATLLEMTGSQDKAVFRKESASKVKMLDHGYARMREPGANNAMVVHDSVTGADDVPSYDAIILDRFDADGGAAAGARVGGGLVTYVAGENGNGGTGAVIPSTVEATSVTVKNGDIAWIEGAPGNQTLKSATRTVLLKTPYGPSAKSGRLVKSAASPTVYFAANDGKRYAFNGIATFNTWFSDFRTVQVLSPLAIAQMPLGGNVLYRPASRLLKSASGPQVYAIGKDGNVHWITSEEVVVQQFGLDWKKQIDVVDATVLADYGFGAPITRGDLYFAVLTR